MSKRKSLELANYEYIEKTVALKNNIEKGFLELGERLKSIRDERMYEPQYDSFDDFIPELKMSHATVSKLINIYEKFVVQYRLSSTVLLEAGGWTVIAELLPIVKSKADAKKWIEKARLLHRNDLRIEIKEFRTGIDQRTCKHTKDFYVLHICRICGFRETIKNVKPEEKL